MERRNFLRNVVLGVAASLLPRILQPSAFEVEHETKVQVSEAFIGIIPWVMEHGNVVYYSTDQSWHFVD